MGNVGTQSIGQGKKISEAKINNVREFGFYGSLRKDFSDWGLFSGIGFAKNINGSDVLVRSAPGTLGLISNWVTNIGIDKKVGDKSTYYFELSKYTSLYRLSAGDITDTAWLASSGFRLNF